MGSAMSPAIVYAAEFLGNYKARQKNGCCLDEYFSLDAF